MVFGTWPSPPARALARIVQGVREVGETLELEPYAVRQALQDGTVDLALLPTFDALRAADAFDIVPDVALVGERSPGHALAVVSPLDQIRSVAFDPRFVQDVLLTQIVLKENYGGRPTFTPVDFSETVASQLAHHDAALVPVDAVPPGATLLDPGQEWVDLTLRPMVWAVVACRRGKLETDAAEALADRAREAEPPGATVVEGARAYQFSLDGYAQDGLDEFIKHLYYHGTLQDFPELAFIEVAREEPRRTA